MGYVRTRGRKLINKLVINKLEKYKFFHVGKNNSHPRKSEKIRENLNGQMIIFPHAFHRSHVIFLALDDFSLNFNLDYISL